MECNKCRAFLIVKETCDYYPSLTMAFSNTSNSSNLISKFLSKSLFPLSCDRKQFCSEIGLTARKCRKTKGNASCIFTSTTGIIVGIVWLIFGLKTMMMGVPAFVINMA